MKKTILALSCVALALAATPGTAVGQSAEGPGDDHLRRAVGLGGPEDPVRRLGPGDRRQ